MGDDTSRTFTLLRLCWRYDVTTAAGRRVQSLKIIGVAMIAITGLLIFVVDDVNEARENIEKTEILEKNLKSSLQVASLIHLLQISPRFSRAPTSCPPSGVEGKYVIPTPRFS